MFQLQDDSKIISWGWMAGWWGGGVNESQGLFYLNPILFKSFFWCLLQIFSFWAASSSSSWDEFPSLHLTMIDWFEWRVIVPNRTTGLVLIIPEINDFDPQFNFLKTNCRSTKNHPFHDSFTYRSQSIAEGLILPVLGGSLPTKRCVGPVKTSSFWREISIDDEPRIERTRILIMRETQPNPTGEWKRIWLPLFVRFSSCLSH